MKMFIVFLILVLISVVSLFAQEVDVKDLRNHIRKETDSIVYEFSCLPTVKPEIMPQDELLYYWYDGKEMHITKGSFSGWLFDGYFKEIDDSGRIIKQGNFNNGLKDGRWKEWWENDNLSRVSEWIKGRVEGEILKYDHSGALINSQTYIDGKLHGPEYIYQGDTLIIERIYKNGTLKREETIIENETD